MERKLLRILIIQNISVFLYLFIDPDFYIFNLFCIELALFIILIKNSTKNYLYYILCVFIPLVFILSNHLTIFENWNIDYNKLKYFSGTTFYPQDAFYDEDDYSHHSSHKRINRHNSTIYNPSMRFIYLQSDTEQARFSCDKTIRYGCNEINNFFGYKNLNNLINEDILYDKRKLSIKYFEQDKYFANFPLVITKSFTINKNIPRPKQGVIYEIAYQGKVIYDYNYFISKYKRQRYKYILYAVYLILNSICFMFIYHSVFQELSFYKNRIDQ